MSNIHPNSIFRWEDAASLEHACWACPTKANSPRALQTCYGVHCMPCVSYHPTMHAVGAAHRCSGCVTTREIHEGRHREIAELMVEYRATEEVSCSASASASSGGVMGEAVTPTVTPTPIRRGRVVLGEIAANIGSNADPHRCGRDGNAKRRSVINQGGQERRAEIGIVVHQDSDTYHADTTGKENKLNDNAANTNENVEQSHFDNNLNDLDDDDGTASLSSYAPSSTDQVAGTSSTKKPTKAQIRAEKKAKKSAKATSKALKNQDRKLATVTSADIERVAQILHGDESDTTRDGSAHPLATDKTIEDVINRNLGFVKNIQAHKAYLFASVAKGRKEVKERKRIKKKESLGLSNIEETVETEGVISAIMIKLGVSPGVVTASTAATPNNMLVATPLRCAANGFASGRKRGSSGPVVGIPSSTGSMGKQAGGAGGASRASVAVAIKLRNAIKVDLEKHENEVHARYVRAGGFWRYVGKSVFDKMMDFARETDVATGESWEKKWAREGKSDVINAGYEEDQELEEDA